MASLRNEKSNEVRKCVQNCTTYVLIQLVVRREEEGDGERERVDLRSIEQYFLL